MSTPPYTPAAFQKTSYNCPYCGAFAVQAWLSLYSKIPGGDPFEQASRDYHMSRCAHCGAVCMWFNGALLIPDQSSAEPPHVDMPPSLVDDFNEARVVFSRSPRSAAAVLRLVIQKLCIELGQKGKNINDDIAALVADGLPVRVQQALDIVRVVGNEQVHPGQLDVRDDPAIAAELFRLVNFIVEDRISRPKAIQELYDRLPQEKREWIEKRDAKQQS